MKPPKTPIVILGAGPAGLALAIRLAQRGKIPVVFDGGPGSPLLVGESLSAAIVSHLHELGVEDQVAAMAFRKCGTRYVSRSNDVVEIRLEAKAGIAPGYSYNVDRPAFDDILRQRALDLGVRFVRRHAELEVVQEGSGGATLRLHPITAALAGYFPGDQPPLLVDATGRKRLVTGILRVPMLRNRRSNVAYFAHFQGLKEQDPTEQGMCIINVLNAGWSWRIPLPGGRTSLGVVVSREQSLALGFTPEERLMRMIRSEPALRSVALGAERVSPVYTQPSQAMTASRGYGPGWVVLGDAFGQIDPMLAAGVYTALEAAKRLDELVLQRQPLPGMRQSMALARYNTEMGQLYQAWSRLSDYYYSGQFFAAFRRMNSGEPDLQGGVLRKFQHFVEARITGMSSGVGTSSWFGNQVLRLAMASSGKHGMQSKEFAVRTQSDLH